MIFQGGTQWIPCPPSGSAHGMHLKEGTCLKCSFQCVVIIGRKVRLDYNSWYACLPLIRHVGRSSGHKLFAERERERDCTVFAHESFVLAWFLRISKVSQSILLQSSAFDEDPKHKRIVRIRVCTAKSDIPQYKR